MKSSKISSLVIALFLMTILVSYNSAPATAAQDTNGHWAQSQIEALLSEEMVSGYPDGSFGPENPITRAEFISMINRVFNFTETAAIYYPDVMPGDWYYNEIAKAKAAGYISGYPDGTMGPNGLITREEMAVIIAQVLHLDTSDTGILSRFSDWGSIPAWSRGAIAAMVRAGYMNGNPDGTFQAGSLSTRAMAAAILAGVLDDRNDDDEDEDEDDNDNHNSGSNDNDNSDPYITDIDADNVTVTKVSKNKYTISMDEEGSIGDVTITFNEAIEKDHKNDIRLRAYSDYNASGLLDWTDDDAEDFVIDLLYDHFNGGNSKELEGTFDSDYGVLYDAMSLYFEGMPEVKCIQIDVYDDSNNKATITFNIYPPEE